MPVKQWNFRKANWSHYIALTNKFAKTLLPPDSFDVDAAYQDFCNTIKKAAKKIILRGYPTQNSQDLEKSACSRDPKTRKARGEPEELSTDISALCPL